MLSRIIPFIGWFKGYNMAALRADAIAGLTVALVLIPQSMAYAQLAGMPAYYGLYASFLPPLVAALFGSSRQLATGPVAVVSLMTAASLEPLATAGSEGYIAYAILLALMVGIFQLLLGVLKLGLVVNFLSHPVVNGFTNAAAIIIASSQLSKMFGVYVDKADHHYETIIRVVESAVHYTHWPTLAMGALAFGIMIVLKRVNPKIPNVLVAVVVTTALSWGLGFNHDAKAPLESIRVPAVHEAINGFNTAVAGIDDLATQRTALGKAMKEAEKGGDPVGILDIEHDQSVVNVKMARLKLQAHELRSELRETLLTGVEQPDGSLLFFAKDAIPAGMTSDGRTWRVKVGNGRLDTAALKMMGGGAVVGSVPSGIPAISAPSLDFEVMLHLVPFAAIISLLGFMEAISIAKAMAAKTGQRLDPNQELIGQGLANILGACGKSYPASGSFSRSAVNLQAGAVTGMSSVFTSLMVVIALLFFTPLLYHLPQAVLAAVIMMAVIGLINASGFIHAWKAQWYDGAISILSFLCTLAFAPHLDKGIMVGVVLSLLVFLYKSMRPRVATLSRSEDKSLRDATAFGLRECRHIALVRFDGPLFFANASFLEDQITERMMGNDKLRHIIIVANGINDMDASGEEALSLIVDRVRSSGLDISLCGVNESVMAVLERTHLLEKIGKDHVYATMENAICATHESAHQDGQEDNCPLTTVCRLA
ncbi:SulP family inorganic anion transporter [Pseudodesulfovibrio thermohalotolerans]|uniref:SulP family inorganic anion transporter n=1 Tax=Pseudodesulfovibrio thermohalotolerans TaxID=2880651 RepID=UPI0024429E79|nr:SulP family inorganic anion transporter [Pseudodesulfovibrio thermohalotolerans]WFS63716.1 SulP family inorganic anion transporter [Pseudodesulfovibrio thermohalotolerans]